MQLGPLAGAADTESLQLADWRHGRSSCRPEDSLRINHSDNAQADNQQDFVAITSFGHSAPVRELGLSESLREAGRVVGRNEGVVLIGPAWG